MDVGHMYYTLYCSKRYEHIHVITGNVGGFLEHFHNLRRHALIYFTLLHEPVHFPI
jgi:hypothetical protein